MISYVLCHKNVNGFLKKLILLNFQDQVTQPWVPLFLFGILCVISSFLLLKLPETHNQPVPETIYEAEIPLESKIEKELNAVALG